MVGLVAGAVNPKVVNQTMLVLVGGQGIGKSTFLYNLLQPLSEYVVSTVVNPLDKDSIINLAENILVIINELDGINRTKEAELKELITLQSIKVRRPYGRFAQTMVRRASFASSTNMEQLISDVSGSRRMLIHTVTEIDYKTPID
jgi:predicted P-loop ATPase